MRTYSLKITSYEANIIKNDKEIQTNSLHYLTTLIALDLISYIFTAA